MKSKEVPCKVSCVTSDLKLECSIVHSRIQDVTLQACGFTQATPTTKELNLQVALTVIQHTSQSLTTSRVPGSLLLKLLQVLLKGTATEMVVDVACLDTAGTVIAHLPAVRPRLLACPEDV